MNYMNMEVCMRSLAVRLLGVGVVTALYLWNTTVGVAALSAVFGYALAQHTWKGAPSTE